MNTKHRVWQQHLEYGPITRIVIRVMNRIEMAIVCPLIIINTVLPDNES